MRLGDKGVGDTKQRRALIPFSFFFMLYFFPGHSFNVFSCLKMGFKESFSQKADLMKKPFFSQLSLGDGKVRWPGGKTSQTVIELTPGYILHLGFIFTYE